MDEDRYAATLPSYSLSTHVMCDGCRVEAAAAAAAATTTSDTSCLFTHGLGIAGDGLKGSGPGRVGSNVLFCLFPLLFGVFVLSLLVGWLVGLLSDANVKE